MSAKRPKLPSDNEANVLIRSRRRCCLCFALRFDTSYKKIQIAHVDHNPRNNKTENLAALCLEHHDEYDITPSQTKRITPAELRKHREALYDVLAKKDGNVIVEFLTPGTRITNLAIPSSQILGELLEAFDSEMEKKLKFPGFQPNGIRVHYIARRALEDFGDFDAASEGLRLLIRLSDNTDHERFLHRQSPLRHATPFPLAMDLLKRFAKTDFLFFLNAVASPISLFNKCLVGEMPLIEIASYQGAIPDSSFEIATSVMCGCCLIPMDDAEWAKEVILDHVAPLIVKLALLLAYKYGPIVPHAGRLFYGASAERTIQPGQPKEQLPFVHLVHRIAFFPEPLFQKAVTKVKFQNSIKTTIFKVSSNGHQLSHVIDLVKGWALSPGGGLICDDILVDSEATLVAAREAITDMDKRGSEAEAICRAWLLEERRLLTTPRT